MLGKAVSAGRGGDFDTAIRLLVEAKSIEPQNSQILTTLGYAYVHCAKIPLAIQVFEESIRSNPNQEKVPKVLADLKKGAETKSRITDPNLKQETIEPGSGGIVKSCGRGTGERILDRCC